MAKEDDLVKYFPDFPFGKVNELSPIKTLTMLFSKYGSRVGILTSFQKTGMIILDLAVRGAPGLRVITIDTGRLHPETYAYIEEIERRYGLRVERFQPDPLEVERMVARHGEYLFFDSKAKQEYCCRIRKVDPGKRALATLDVCVVGLRRDQSENRKGLGKFFSQEMDGRRILKMALLADWREEEVDAYIQEHQIPIHPLFSHGYSSIGCVICSTPVLPGEPLRAGRWRWFNYLGTEDKKECGLHTLGGGI